MYTWSLPFFFFFILYFGVERVSWVSHTRTVFFFFSESTRKSLSFFYDYDYLPLKKMMLFYCRHTFFYFCFFFLSKTSEKDSWIFVFKRKVPTTTTCLSVYTVLGGNVIWRQRVSLSLVFFAWVAKGIPFLESCWCGPIISHNRQHITTVEREREKWKNTPTSLGHLGQGCREFLSFFFFFFSLLVMSMSHTR